MLLLSPSAIDGRITLSFISHFLNLLFEFKCLLRNQTYKYKFNSITVFKLTSNYIYTIKDNTITQVNVRANKKLMGNPINNQHV